MYTRAVPPPRYSHVYMYTRAVPADIHLYMFMYTRAVPADIHMCTCKPGLSLQIFTCVHVYQGCPCRYSHVYMYTRAVPPPRYSHVYMYTRAVPADIHLYMF